MECLIGVKERVSLGRRYCCVAIIICSLYVDKRFSRNLPIDLCGHCQTDVLALWTRNTLSTAAGFTI